MPDTHKPVPSRRKLLGLAGTAAFLGLTATSSSPLRTVPLQTAQSTRREAGAVEAGLAASEPFGRRVNVVEGADDYFIPSLVDAADGSYMLVYRAGTAHAFANGSDPGRLFARHSADEGMTFGPSRVIADFSAQKLDIRDPYLYREPGKTRIWLTFFTGVRALTGGTWIMYSDDHGSTWSRPEQMAASSLSPGGIRRSIDGVWRMPVYRRIGGYWRASLVTSENPTGPWSAPIDVLAPYRSDATEWDFVEVSPANWVAVVRGSARTNGYVVQSKDRGRTWSSPVELPSPGAGLRYDAWPALRMARDGRVLCFIRAAGGGQRLVQLFDPAKPLTQSNWGEQAGGGLLDTASNGSCGKFQPFQRGTAWVSAYLAETAGKQAAEIRIGAFDERSLRSRGSVNVAAEAPETKPEG